MFLPWVYHFTVTMLSPLDDNYVRLVLTEIIMHKASLYISYILYTQTACTYMQAYSTRTHTLHSISSAYDEGVHELRSPELIPDPGP